MLTALALLLTTLSALACYAGSANCRWRRGHLGRAGTVAGLVLALAALAAWITALGVGAGLSVMLGSWGAVAIALPYLALRVPAPVSSRGDG